MTRESPQGINTPPVGGGLPMVRQLSITEPQHVASFGDGEGHDMTVAEGWAGLRSSADELRWLLGEARRATPAERREERFADRIAEMLGLVRFMSVSLTMHRRRGGRA